MICLFFKIEEAVQLIQVKLEERFVKQAKRVDSGIFPHHSYAKSPISALSVKKISVYRQ